AVATFETSRPGRRPRLGGVGVCSAASLRSGPGPAGSGLAPPVTASWTERELPEGPMAPKGRSGPGRPPRCTPGLGVATLRTPAYSYLPFPVPRPPALPAQPHTAFPGGRDDPLFGEVPCRSVPLCPPQSLPGHPHHRIWWLVQAGGLLLLEEE
ncbi:hypothetical protein H1C71_035065, partial [Ictidomys tridecemlineatus]